MTVTRAAAALAVAAAVAVPRDAAAHEEGGVRLTPVVQSVAPPIAGVSVAALPSIAPLLELRNRTATDVVVLGEAGEPFLRIGRRGVLGNRRSPTLRRSADPSTQAPPAGRRAVRGRPDWHPLHGRPAWRWFDPRLRARPRRPGARVPFAVPLVAGGRRVLVRGFVQSGEIGHLRAVLDEAPPVRRVQVRLADGTVPALFVRNDSGRVLEVPGLTGEPMLRIGPGGVSANTRSPSFHRAAGHAIRAVPPTADPAARPRWRRLSRRPAWAWLERRAHVPATGAQALRLGSRRRTVARWSVPARLGRRAVSIAGRIEWLPARAATPEPAGRLAALPTAARRAATSSEGGSSPALTAIVAALAALGLGGTRRRVRGRHRAA